MVGESKSRKAKWYCGTTRTEFVGIYDITSYSIFRIHFSTQEYWNTLKGRLTSTLPILSTATNSSPDLYPHPSQPPASLLPSTNCLLLFYLSRLPPTRTKSIVDLHQNLWPASLTEHQKSNEGWYRPMVLLLRH